jgi:hypothetical protein
MSVDEFLTDQLRVNGYLFLPSTGGGARHQSGPPTRPTISNDRRALS